jgi:nicotinamide riboside transporter PnuC
MTTFHSITIILTIASLIGVVLNIKRRRECFIVWACTNFNWALIDYHQGIYAQSVLFFIYFLLSLYGLWEWRKEKPGSVL